MKLEVGDYVRIESLSEEQKHYYPFGWVPITDNRSMNMDKFIGTVTKITHISTDFRYKLECDAGRYVWHDSHLKRIRKSDIMLF